MTSSFPHPLALLTVCIFAAAALASFVLPAGEYDRQPDPATGRTRGRRRHVPSCRAAPGRPVPGARRDPAGARRSRLGGLPRLPRRRRLHRRRQDRRAAAGGRVARPAPCSRAKRWSSRSSASPSRPAARSRTCARRSSRWSRCCCSSPGSLGFDAHHRGRDQHRRRRGRRGVQPDQSLPGADRPEARRACRCSRAPFSASSSWCWRWLSGSGERGGTPCGRAARPRAVRRQQAHVHLDATRRHGAGASSRHVRVFLYGVMQLGWDFDQMSALFFAMGVLAGLVGGLGAGGTAQAFVAGFAVDGLRRHAGRLRPRHLRRAGSRAVIDTVVHGLTVPLQTLPVVASADRDGSACRRRCTARSRASAARRC